MSAVRRSLFSLALVIAAGIAGCASTRGGDAEQDAALKAFRVHPYRSGVFVYRDPSSAGPATTTVEIDGRPIGFTPPATYLYLQVPVGRHVVAARSDGYADALEFEAEPGKLVFFRQEVRPEQSFSWRGGLSATPIKLHAVTETEGQQRVLASRLAENPVQPARRVQTIEFAIEADAPSLRAPMECEATNDLGRWTFVAPGTVEVHVSDLALDVACTPSVGRVAIPLAVMPRSNAEAGKSGLKTGALIGGFIGVGLGVAAAPVMGAGFGAALAAGGAIRGAEIGGLVGLATTPAMAYPAVMSIRVVAQPASTQPVSPPN